MNAFLRKKLILFKENQIVLDSFWAIIGNIVGKGFSFVAGIYIARILGRESFGQYGIIISTIISASVLSTLGLGYTATKLISESREKSLNQSALIIYYSRRITLVVSFFLSIILFILSSKISCYVVNTYDLELSFKIMAIWVVFNALSTLHTGILAGFGEFKKIAKLNTISGFLNFLLTVSLTYHHGILGALIASLINQIVIWYLSYIAIKDVSLHLNKHFTKNRHILYDILQFTTPIALQEGLYSFSAWFMSWLFIVYSTPSDLGMYMASNQIGALILFIPGILKNVLLSHLSKTVDNLYKNQSILQTSLKVNVLATAMPVLIVYICKDYLSSTYGGGYVGIGNLIFLVSITTIFTSINNVLGQVFMSRGQNWLLLFLRIMKDLTLIISFIFFVKKGIVASELLVWSNLILGIIYMGVLAIFLLKNKIPTD